MEYINDFELCDKVNGLIQELGMNHIPPGGVRIIRSRGSKSRRTLARIHAVPKVVQKGLGIPPHYVIEVISENFDKLSEEDKVKTLIHELLHVPHAFGGGFRHHRRHVNKRTIEKAYKKLPPTRRLW